MGQIKSAETIHLLCCYTDHPVNFIGGNSICVFGTFGAGKTTLTALLEEQAMYVENAGRETYIFKKKAGKDVSKINIIPTTVIHLGREWETWNSLLPAYFKSKWKLSDTVKDVYIHMREGEEYKFTVDGVEYKPPEEICRTYKKVFDLIKNLVPGAINIVYPPHHHNMSLALVKELETRRLDPSKMNVKESKMGIVKMYGKYAKFTSPQYWLFDLLVALPRTKRPNEPILVSIDEVHNYLPARSSGLTWHLIEAFSNVLVDYRKNNLSFLCTTHSAQYIDYRIVGRIQYLYILKGADVGVEGGSSTSMVFNSTLGKLQKGDMIVEEKKQQFGIGVFPPLPGRLPLVQCTNFPKIDIKSDEDTPEELAKLEQQIEAEYGVVV